MTPEEWREKSEKLAQEYEDYCDEYRKKICEKKCKIWNLREMRKGRIYESGKCYCDHMINARTKKLGHKVEEIMVALMEMSGKRITSINKSETIK